jgi:hypothetical protein
MYGKEDNVSVVKEWGGEKINGSNCNKDRGMCEEFCSFPFKM